MELKDLQLGDVIEVDHKSSARFTGAGRATIVGLDRHSGSSLPVLIAWNDGDPITIIKVGHDGRPSYGSYLPDVEKHFRYSHWITFSSVVSKVGVRMHIPVLTPKERACPQCSKMNDIGSAKCWWCCILNPCPHGDKATM